MIKTVLKIDGMMCGMCESHINDAVRREFKVIKVSSSHTKGESVIVSESELDGTCTRRKYTLINTTYHMSLWLDVNTQKG